MNGRPDEIDMRDVDVVAGVFKAMLSEKWISVLVPESEIQRFAMNAVRALKEDRAQRK